MNPLALIVAAIGALLIFVGVKGLTTVQQRKAASGLKGIAQAVTGNPAQAKAWLHGTGPYKGEPLGPPAFGL